VGSTVTRTEYIYDGQMPVIERDYNSSGNLSQTRVNILGARGIEGIITIPASGSASLNWLMYDGHGNVVRTIDTNFNLSAYQWRGVWGERQTGTLQTGKGYCANLGQQEDETGFIYMRARYYEPTTGRFVSEDPARDGVNWYLYAHDNPIRFVDDDGRNAVDVIFFLYQTGLGFLLAGIALLYKWEQSHLLKSQLAKKLAMGIEADTLQTLMDELTRIYRYIKHHETQALRLSKARGGIADVLIYYVAGEAVIITLEILFGEWL